jgi:glycosyltransferase involved in cell wall biosynthesis
MIEARRDVFVCHASEDKDEIVRPLVSALQQAKISCWYDEAEIRWGESITEKVNQGLSLSKYVMVVFTPTFIQKPWPKREFLAGLNEEASTDRVKILPLLVGSKEEQEQIGSQFYLLNDKMYLSWNGDPANVVEALLSLLHPNSQNISRACFISSEYPPYVLGGLGVHVHQLTRALGAHINVNVVLPSPSSNEGYQSLHPQVGLYALSKADASYDDPVSWLRFADFAAERIRRLTSEARPDVIHCHDWVTVLAGIKSRWRLEIPLVFHLHLPNRSPLCASVENLGLICADLITLNSEAMYEELMDRNLPLRCPVEVVKNGVDQDAFRPGEEWPDADGYVLYTGRLVEQKGVEYLLRALHYVKEKFPDVRLKVVGDGPLRDALERLCKNLMLSEHVEFLGWKTGQELVRIYQRALVAMVPSIYEPFGMTALEAMACRRPVVASRTGGLTDIIEHKVTGFLAEPKDELDLAQWLMTLLSSSDLRNRMGEAGSAYVCREGYAWPEIARRFIGLYAELRQRPLDKSIPARAEELKQEIINVAEEMSPSLAGKSNNLLDRLFNWMDRS